MSNLNEMRTAYQEEKFQTAELLPTTEFISHTYKERSHSLLTAGAALDRKTHDGRRAFVDGLGDTFKSSLFIF